MKKKKLIQLLLPLPGIYYRYYVRVLDVDGSARMAWYERRDIFYHPAEVAAAIRKEFEISDLYKVVVKVIER